MQKKKKATIEDVLEIVVSLDKKVGSLDKNVVSLNQKVESLEETVEFLKDNMVSKDGLEEKTTELKNEIVNHVDSFVGLHQKLDTEFTSLRAKCERLELQQNKIAKHVGLQLS